MKNIEKESILTNSRPILILDGANLMHRARSGFTTGDYAIVYNFFRGLRPLIEKFKPARVYMALEGHPQKRFDLLPEYKANRHVDPGTPKHDSLVDFHRQKRLILDLLERHFPISLVRHPNYEADDTISNLVQRGPSTTEFVIVTSDTDFTQLLQLENVKVYNPVKKSFLEWNPDDCYVIYKALKGDATDNIPGIPGFGEVKAMKYAKGALANPIKSIKEMVDLGLSQGEATMKDIARNLELVRFAAWTDEEYAHMTCSTPTRDWSAVAQQFDEWEFASITKIKTWTKFVETFDPLFESTDVA